MLYNVMNFYLFRPYRILYACHVAFDAAASFPRSKGSFQPQLFLFSSRLQRRAELAIIDPVLLFPYCLTSIERSNA